MNLAEFQQQANSEKESEATELIHSYFRILYKDAI